MVDEYLLSWLLEPRRLRVQIPLWSMNTPGILSATVTDYLVQIPLWSMNTPGLIADALREASSDSSMVDEYLPGSLLHPRV